MATATAVLTCPVCGEQFTKSATKFNRKQADEWEKWMEDQDGQWLCPDCYREEQRKKKEEAAREAAAKALEDGFAELEGTEKQVHWAEEIRGNFAKNVALTEAHIEKMITHKEEATQQNLDKLTGKGKSLTEAIEIINREWDKIDRAKTLVENLKKIRTASWWIDHKEKFDADRESANVIFGMLLLERRTVDDAARQVEKETESQETKEKAETLEVLTPKNQTCSVVPIIKVTEDKVILQSDYSKDIVDVMHEIFAKWDKPYWVIKITDRSGSAIDRGAEMAHKLLQAGIPVKIENEEVKEKALNGTYEKRQTKWIDISDDMERVIISWGSGDDDLYYESKKLPGAKYKDYKMTVPVSSYRDILDFADLNGCTITDAAMRAIDAFKASEVTVEVADKEVEKTAKEKLEDQLKKPAEVIDDLLDD